MRKRGITTRWVSDCILEVRIESKTNKTYVIDSFEAQNVLISVVSLKNEVLAVNRPSDGKVTVKFESK
jgi:hypothetical protein